MLSADLSIKSSLAPLIFPTRHPRYPRRPKFQPPRDRRTFNLRRNPRFQVFAEYGVGVSADDSSKMGEECSLVEISATRTLPAAVTYMEGVRRLRAAVEEVKANPPGFSSGVLRFQDIMDGGYHVGGYLREVFGSFLVYFKSAIGEDKH